MRCSLLSVAAALTLGLTANADEPKPLKVGIIGLDTSHVAAFTSIFNGPKPRPELAGVRVVAAYPGGSPDVESSRQPRQGLHRYPEGQVRRRDRRQHRRAIAEGGRGSAGKRRWPAASGAAQARPQGRQAGLHRQAGRRFAGRRHPDLRPGESSEGARFLQLVAPLCRRRDRHEEEREARHHCRLHDLRPVRAGSRTIPTCSGTASTASRCCTR